MKIIAITSLITLGLSFQVQSADIEAGKAKAASCAGCHGAAGISANESWPNLAGQKELYLVKQIKDFKSGVRKDPMMGAMVSNLTDEDINNIAAYYASLK